MKKPEWIFVGVLLLVASYFVFSYVTRKKDFKSWSLVTSNAALVYETKSITQTWNYLVNSKPWESLQQIPDLATINKNLQLIDTLSGGNGSLAAVLTHQNVLISTHVTSQNSFGFTYIIPLGNKGHNLFIKILASLQQQQKITTGQRVYQAQTIYEVNFKTKKLSYIIYKNTLVLSTNAFLVEDVVRNIKSGFEQNFISQYPNVSGNPSFRTDQGNLYINGYQLPLLANTLLTAKQRLPLVPQLAASLFLDVSLNQQGLFTSGFAFNTDTPSLAATFKNQQTRPLKLNELIPKNAAIVEHIGSSNLAAWYKQWAALHAKSISNVQQGTVFVGFLKDELANITLPSLKGNPLNKLFIANLADKAGMLNHLNKLAEKQLASGGQDSLYIEQYAGFEIRLIDKEPILKDYFGQDFSGFNSTYYLVYHNQLLIANTAEILRNWLMQLENEFTWSKSVRMNAFFKDALTEANYTFVVNFEYAQNLFIEKLNQKTKNWVKKNKPVLKDFNLLAFQISNLDNRYYANFSINYAPKPKRVVQQNISDVATIQLANPVALMPQLVKNHKSGSLEIILQDSLNNLLLIGANNEILWADSLGEAIKAPIHQIDFYANNKLQYLLHSDSTLYLIDRNGKAVEGYPIKFPFKINKLYIIDYDQSKRYRLLISDLFGNLYMYTKEGRLLEGWNPNAFKTKLADDVFHLRVRGKDRIFVPLSNGNIYLTNRRGQVANGFPLNLDMPVKSGFFVEAGESFGDTQFTTVSPDGLVVRFTMEGKMLSRNQLFKESDESNFILLKDQHEKDYVFVRKDVNRVAIMSAKGEVLFEKDFIDTGLKKVQFYNLGADRQIFAIKSGADVFLYNRQGKLLNNEPLSSEYAISLVYFGAQNMCYLYLVNSNTIEIKKIYL